MSTNSQPGKCYECKTDTELWYFDGGFFCKECVRQWLDGKPLHDEFMLADWIKEENREIQKRMK